MIQTQLNINTIVQPGAAFAPGAVGQFVATVPRLYNGTNWIAPTSEPLEGGKVYGIAAAGTDYTLTIVAPGTRVLVTMFTWGADVPIVGTLRLNLAKIAQFGGYGGCIQFPYGELGADGDDIIGRVDFVTGVCNVAMNVHYYLI